MAMLAKDRHDNKYSPVAYAHRLRRIITQWCLRDFGIRSRVRKVSNLFEVAKLTDEDKEILKELCDKYPALSDSKVLEEFPPWIIEKARNSMIDEAINLHRNVVKANSNIPQSEGELMQRRLYVNAAIASNEALIRDLDYIADIFNLNLNSLEQLCKMLEKEKANLKKMRKTDARDFRKRQETKKVCAED